MLMKDLSSVLRDFDALRDQEYGGDLVQRKVLEKIAPTYTTTPIAEKLDKHLQGALSDAGIKQF